jgi:hypothetical protein
LDAPHSVQAIVLRSFVVKEPLTRIMNREKASHITVFKICFIKTPVFLKC